jgi:phosphatidylserine decarboxylase
MSAHDPDAPRGRLFVALQYLLPQHLLSQLAHQLARSELRWLKDLLIRAFLSEFHPDMSEAAEPDPYAYPSFNAFFTRALRAGARQVTGEPSALVSPVDGTISQLGALDGSWLVQAKGLAYTLESLLGSPSWAESFRGGAFATIYLAPRNYHRVHMPAGGTLQAAWYLPGALFSVNATTTASVPGLFARNERVVCVFGEGAQLGFAVVLVGALLVGSMATVWHGEITPRSPRRRAELPLDNARAALAQPRGAELGRFNMGSTVIVLLPPARGAWRAGLEAGASVRLGEPLGQLH